MAVIRKPGAELKARIWGCQSIVVRVLRNNLRGDQFEPVFVMKAAENWYGCDAMSARKLVAGRSWHRQRRRLGNSRTETRVGAAVIVMRHPRAQNLSQMALVDRNQMVKTFTTHGADHTLTERVRLWHTGQRLQDARIHGPQGPVNRR
jgi:hypothetical protein